MGPRRRLAPLLLASVVAALAVAPAVAGADAVIAEDAGGDVRADAGYVAWAEGRGFAVRRTTGAGSLRRIAAVGGAGSFDVGRGPAGGALIAWVGRCSNVLRTCTVRAVPTGGGTARVLTRVPYDGVEAPVIALDGTRLVFTRSVLRRGTQCDSLHVRGLQRGGRLRELDAGLRCGLISDVEIEGRHVAFAIESGIDALDGEVRAVRSDGSRRSVPLDYALSAESLEYIDGLAMDGGLVYTTHLGNRREHFIRRRNPETGRGSDALAFADLGGGFARDRGRHFVRQNATTVVDPIDGEFGTNSCIASFVGASCFLVAGDDPWAGRRRLLPEVTVNYPTESHEGAPPFVIVSGYVTRRTAERRRRGAAVGVAGAAVTLALRSNGPPDEDAVTESLATARTDASGYWQVTIRPRLDATYRALALVPGVGAPVGSDELTLGD